MELPVIISYCNNGYYDFAKNLLINLNQTIKSHRVCFYCLDEEIYERLKILDLKCIDINFVLWKNCNVSKDFLIYGSDNYNLLTHTKINILRDALAKFNYIHFIDCDVVCLKEPTIEHYNKYKDYDIVFQYDAGMYSENSLHAPTLHHIWACTGNTSMRNSSGTKFLLDKIAEYQNIYKNKNDQECLFQFFQDIKIEDIRDFKEANLFTYEINEYTNGFWLQNNIGSLKNTYFFHANHVAGNEKKIQLLKKANALFI